MPETKDAVATVDLAKRPKLDEQVIVWDTDKGEVKLSVALVRMYFCPEASTVEAMTFLSVCKYQRLNPWLREAYLIKYGAQPAALVVGKDTFSKRAVRHPAYRGFQAGIVVRPAAEVPLERREGSLLLKGEELVGGWCRVYLKDREPVYAEVSLTEYEGKTRDGNLNRTWSGKSCTMIRKVAFVQAHREAMPEEFEGLYDESEIRPEEKRPESFGMPLSVAEAAAKEAEPVDADQPGTETSGAPDDEFGLAEEAAAREQAEAQAEQEAPPAEPAKVVDRPKVWSAVLRRAKAQGVTAPAVLMALTGKSGMPGLSDAEVLALAKKLEASA